MYRCHFYYNNLIDIKNVKIKIRGRNLTVGALINEVLSVIERRLSYRRLNLWKTCWINFRSLPISQAIHFPVYVYGSMKIMSLRGKFIIDAPLKRGLIKFGLREYYDLVGCNESVFENRGLMVFKGKTVFYNGYLIKVSNNVIVNVGKEFLANNNLVIIATDDLTIGDYCRIGFNAKILTSDYHFSIKLANREVINNHNPIVIGKYNWITTDVKILKGAVTPNWTTVVSNSVLNRDYSDQIPENSIIGGQPAKLIKTGQRRIFSTSGQTEKMLNNYFHENPTKKFTLNDEFDIDIFCIE